MPLDPQLQALRDQWARAGAPPLYTLSLAEARAADLAQIQAGSGEPEPVARVTDRSIPGPGGPLRVRIYEPGQGEEFGGRAGLVYFFGGGWTLGSLETGDAVCRALANAVPCTVVAVEYRLAPEHRFPAAVHDCFAGAQWVAGHAAELGLDPERLGVGGDSAGGNLAAAVTLLARDRGGPRLRHQLLVYPNTNYHADTASLRESEDPVLFNRWSVDWYWGHYLADPRDGLDPLASPLRAPDLSALPAATVLTAEYDPLRDEGEQYADRLRTAGVEVEARRFSGLAHGFFTMSGVLDAAKEAVGYAAVRLAAGLAPK